MIFLAKGMDASANNIGKVSIKTIGDVAESTKTILRTYGGTYSDDQVIAMDDFMDSVTTYGDKIKSLILPFLAPQSDTRINFGTLTPKMYDIIGNDNRSVTAALTNGAQFVVNNGGVEFCSDKMPTSGTYLYKAYIPSDAAEYGICAWGNDISIKDYRFSTEEYKVGIVTSAGISIPTKFFAPIPTIGGDHLCMLRWSDSEAKIKAYVDGVLKADYSTLSLTKPILDESNAIYPMHKEHPDTTVKFIAQYENMTDADCASFSKSVLELMSAFGH